LALIPVVLVFSQLQNFIVLVIIMRFDVGVVGVRIGIAETNQVKALRYFS